MIRLASEKEALEIMSEPQIVERVGKVAHKFCYQPWVAYNDLGHRLLFVFYESDYPKFEIHIASPKDSILSCRKLAKEALIFIFAMGAESIVTDCPKGKISNMAKKMGMSLVKKIKNQHYYEVKLWELPKQ